MLTRIWLFSFTAVIMTWLFAAGATPAASVSGTVPAAALVIDHTTTDLAQVPEFWLTQARNLSFHFAHTSHGSQIVTGLEWWETQRPALAVDVRYAVAPPGPAGELNLYDGNDYAGDNYITPEMYWSTGDGRTHTGQVADSGLFGYSMWSWCGQQSSNSVVDVNTYLDTLDQFEAAHPAMRFIYMTGHTDGGSATLARNNQMVRDFVQANDKVLFDFADIESYDPAGNFYPDTDDSCPWCAQWCSDHPADCAGLPDADTNPDWCAHTHPFLCRQKAQAFWWMMARLAGWPGPDGTTHTTYLPVVNR